MSALSDTSYSRKSRGEMAECTGNGKKKGATQGTRPSRYLEHGSRWCQYATSKAVVAICLKTERR